MARNDFLSKMAFVNTITRNDVIAVIGAGKSAFVLIEKVQLFM